jgi:hypothetical protein
MIDNAAEVPQVFVKETERATKPTLVEEPFRPIVKKMIEALRGIDFDTAPKLHGYTASKIKPTAELVLASDKDQPVLARWQYGLGRAVAFTPDVKDRWAADWVKWPGYGKFFAQLARETMRRPPTSDLGLDVERIDETFRVRLRTEDERGAGVPAGQAGVEVIGPDGQTSTLALSRMRGGLYEGWLRPAVRGDYVLSATAAGGAPAELFSRLVSYAPPTEEPGRPPDLGLLRAISHDTRGVFDPRFEDLRPAAGATVSRRLELWPYLAAAALGLYLLDMLLRKLRFFDRVVFVVDEHEAAHRDTRAA